MLMKMFYLNSLNVSICILRKDQLRKALFMSIYISYIKSGYNWYDIFSYVLFSNTKLLINDCSQVKLQSAVFTFLLCFLLFMIL